ncbi:hypothetical protein LTS14_005913 [Recurvomyces mirabilis]|nr:hypothetical protein LTS14_005913 [Recurvomyces mirabilis]
MAYNDIDLSSTFVHAGWEIKYALLSPHPEPSKVEQTVVFVHGTPWSSDVFHPIAKALLARRPYDILLYDCPGYGTSQTLQPGNHPKTHGGKFSGDTSIKAQGAALSALLTHLKLDGKGENIKPSVIAHDIAGTIALRTHLIHGCQYRSLMLWDTNVVLPWGDGFYKHCRAEPDLFLQLPSKIFEGVVRAVIQSATYNPNVLKRGWEDILAAYWIGSETSQKAFVQHIAQANDDDVAEMLDGNLYEKVACPVKILWGEDDKWIPREKMERLAEMVKHVLKEFVTVPEAGHLLMLDQPERVAIEVYDWLSSE